MNEIAVVVPVLNRPARVGPLVASFREGRTVDSRIVFVVGEHDRAQRDAVIDAGVAATLAREPDVSMLILDGELQPGDFARKVNHAFRWTTEPWIFQAADDVTFEKGWDTEALRVAEETGAGVVGTNDMANPQVKLGKHSTHSLIRRSYVEECGGSLDGPGVVFHEGYGHQWCDTELVELAKSRGCFAAARNSLVPAAHPFWRTAEWDDTYRRGQATASEDARLYKERRRQWA